MVAASRVYSAFMKGDASIVMRSLTRSGYRIDKAMEVLEKQKRSALRPLVLVPYIGAFLLTVTTLLFLQYFTDLSSIGGTSVPYILLNRMLLTPLILHSYMLGLVAGKICSGRLSSGFKHSIFLVTVSLLGIVAMSHFKLFSFWT